MEGYGERSDGLETVVLGRETFAIVLLRESTCRNALSITM